MESWWLSVVLADPEMLKSAFPSIDSIGEPIRGGQKTVYPVVIAGKTYAFKVLEGRGNEEDGRTVVDSLQSNDHLPRVLREVKILEECNIPQLVRLGPIKLTKHTIQGQCLICYTEDWVEGDDLKALLSRKQLLSQEDAVRLGLDITEAIRALWSLRMVHRDIKPANIIRRNKGRGYVLLDPGIALDLEDTSLTMLGHFPGSFPYYSPEQMDIWNKRTMDFRSDFFNLGTVLYETTCGTHPFVAENDNFEQTISNILNSPPKPLSNFRADLSDDFSEVVLRLIGKKPYMRYNSCDRLKEALEQVGA